MDPSRQNAPLRMTTYLDSPLSADCMLRVLWREFPKTGYSFGHERQRDIDIFGDCLLAQAEADTGPRLIRSEPHRHEHVRRLNRARGTGSACRDREALQIQRNDHRFAVDMVEVNVRSIRHTCCTVAIHSRVFDLREDTLLQPVARCGHLLVIAAVERFFRNLRGLAQANDSGYVLRPGATRTLMPAAVKQRLKASSLPHIERSYALWRVNLVAGNREELATDSRHINRNFGGRLHRVRMKTNSGFGRDLALLRPVALESCGRKSRGVGNRFASHQSQLWRPTAPRPYENKLRLRPRSSRSPRPAAELRSHCSPS